jgi:hypothetical protein
MRTIKKEVFVHHESGPRTFGRGYFNSFPKLITWAQLKDVLDFKLGPGQFRIVEDINDPVKRPVFYVD